MRFLSRSGNSEPKPCSMRASIVYESVITVESQVMTGVTFAINRISFARRMELSRQVREISRKAEFLEAGNSVQENIDVRILAQEVDVMYLRWGLVKVEGLTIDGEAASAEQMIERGPEELVREIVRAIKEECGLSEAERKN